MKTQNRFILALAGLVLVLAACSTTAGAPTDSAAPDPTAPASPSVAPSEAPSEAPVAPSEAPEADEREVAGTITVAEMAFSGPGGTIQEAIDAGSDPDMPSLVRGVLFRDTDGRIYVASDLADAAAPSFDGPMLEVLNMASDGPSWDMANAEALGLQEANGIVFLEDAQVLGYIELP
jgi:predicted small secreted protein